MHTFFCDQDYQAYLSMVGQCCGQESVSVCAHWPRGGSSLRRDLMSNHPST
jgi:hypothetical protein